MRPLRAASRPSSCRIWAALFRSIHSTQARFPTCRPMAFATIPMASAVAPTGKIFACEPLALRRKSLADRLARQHPELEQIVTIYPYALSDHEAVGEFVVATDALAYSGLRERIYDTPTGLKR